MLAGGWAVLLILYRALDQPDDMGIQWGMFGAFVAAGALVAAGAARARDARARAAEPGRRRRRLGRAPPRERERTPDRRPRDATAVTEMLRDRPAWEGEVPRPLAREDRRRAAGPVGGADTSASDAADDDEQTQRLWEDDSDLTLSGPAADYSG